jgi:hypothetical protein
VVWVWREQFGLCIPEKILNTDYADYIDFREKVFATDGTDLHR